MNDIKKVFFGLSGGVGSMIRCLPVAINLKKMGYEIYYYSRDYSSHYMNLYGFKQLNVSYHKMYNAGICTTKEWTDLEHFAALYENDKDYFFIKYNSWIRYIKELNPDLIVSDFSLGSSIAGRILGIPVVSISQACYLYPIKSHKNIRWWENCKKPENIHVLENLNAFLRSHRSSTVNIFEEIFIGDIVFIPSIPEFDDFIFEGLPIEFIGPVQWSGNDSLSIRQLTEIDDIIYVYLGRLTDTCGDSGRIILDSIKKIAGKFNAKFLISTANFDQITEPLPQNMIVTNSWFPVGDIYTNSKLVIHHGGHNSCLGTLKFGTPSFIIPTHTEREFNARMLKKMGCCEMIPEKSLFIEELIEKINSTINNGDLLKQSKLWKDTIEKRRYKGEARILEYIIKII